MTARQPHRKTSSIQEILDALYLRVGRYIFAVDQLSSRVTQVVEDQDLMNARVAARLTALEAEVKQRH